MFEEEMLDYQVLASKSGTPGATRTHDTRFRNVLFQVLLALIYHFLSPCQDSKLRTMVTNGCKERIANGIAKKHPFIEQYDELVCCGIPLFGQPLQSFSSLPW
ncbi:hypothetical protein ACFLYS_02280 [Chloroflexota bacterium]